MKTMSSQVYKPGDYVKYDKQKAIIPNRDSILEFWKDLRSSDQCPPIYKTMTDDQFVESQLNVYNSESCMFCRHRGFNKSTNTPDIHPAYVIYFVDPITNTLTGQQDTHICENKLKLWK